MLPQNFPYDQLNNAERTDFEAWIDDCKADTLDPQPSDLIPYDPESDNPVALTKTGWTRHDEVACEHMIEQFGNRADFQCAQCFAKSKGFDDLDEMNRLYVKMFGPVYRYIDRKAVQS